MFGQASNEEIPLACRTEQPAWDDLISDIWKAAFEALMPFALTGTIIEVGPGVSTKVLRALSKIRFSGNVVVVDASPQAIGFLAQGDTLQAPPYRVELQKGTLDECLAQIPVGADIFIMSHVIDDMVMFEALKYATPAIRDSVFGWQANGTYALVPTQVYTQAWQAVEQDKSLLERAKQDVLAGLMHALKTLKPKAIMFSQYPSATLYDNGMASLNDHAHEIFEALQASAFVRPVPQKIVQQHFNTVKNYNHYHIGNHILNAAYWLLAACEYSLEPRDESQSS